MKEMPIILDAEAVRLIKQGNKTQHRDPVHKFMTIKNLSDISYYLDGITDSMGRFFRYPYGCVGERIWVREPFRIAAIQYKADGEKETPQVGIGGFQPSMYMPRWASRITMDIEGVRIEPLQSMSQQDAAAEGSDLFEYPGIWNRRFKETELSYAANPMVFVTTFRPI